MLQAGLTPFAAALREARLAAGLSQSALARRSGLAQQWISQLESGLRGQRLTRAKAQRLADAVGLGDDHPLTRAMLDSAGRLDPPTGELADVAHLYRADPDFRAVVRSLVALHATPRSNHG